MRYENIIVIEGLDGSGKSTAAIGAAEALSDEFPRLQINVTDSTGLFAYKGGKLHSKHFREIGTKKPRKDQNRFQQAVQAFKFARLRKRINRIGESADLLISVRDPDRLDLALYAAVYGPTLLNKLGIKPRLQIADKLTRAPHASAIVMLHTSADMATKHITSRNLGQELDPHEDPVLLQKFSKELPEAIYTYEQLFGAAALEIEGLRESTIEELMGMLSPIAHAAR